MSNRRKGNKIIINGNIAEFHIHSHKNGDFICFVDRENIPLISEYSWGIKKGRNNTFYAQAHTFDKNRKGIFMHRILMEPIPEKMIIDHIDRNGLNNLKSNLRICTNRENCLNKAKCQSNKSSKYKGVRFNKERNCWMASIQIGSFNTEEEAALAYDKAAKYHFGKYACLNFKE